MTQKLKANELFSCRNCKDEDTLSGLTSSRFSGGAAESSDKWLAGKLASFLAAWDKKQPGCVSFTFIKCVISNITFWVNENVMEGFSFREYVEDFFPPVLPDSLHNESIKFNPVFWAIFDILHQKNPYFPVMDYVKTFEKHLFDSRFVYETARNLYCRQFNNRAA
jgi:hypothetical protein